MAARGIAAAAVVALGLARGPGCGGVDDPDGQRNAPCTRSSDCKHDLRCMDGVCRDPDDPKTPAITDAGVG